MKSGKMDWITLGGWVVFVTCIRVMDEITRDNIPGVGSCGRGQMVTTGNNCILSDVFIINLLQSA